METLLVIFQSQAWVWRGLSHPLLTQPHVVDCYIAVYLRESVVSRVQSVKLWTRLPEQSDWRQLAIVRFQKPHSSCCSSGSSPCPTEYSCAHKRHRGIKYLYSYSLFMGKKPEKVEHRPMPNVYRDGFTVPSVTDLHTTILGGHPIHPARLPKKGFK